MNSRKPGYTASLLAGAALVLILAACGGGGGSSSSPTTGSGSSGVPNTPATQRAATIAQHADSLLIPSQQVDVTIRAQGQSETQWISERFHCAAVRCEGTRTGVVVDLDGVGDIVAAPPDHRDRHLIEVPVRSCATA